MPLPLNDTPRVLKQTKGIALFLIGFSIWILDNTFCHHLRNTRNTILLPWAAVLEGHAWWHIFTGLGAYYFIIWRVWLERCLDGGEVDFVLHWPSALTSVPRIRPRRILAAGKAYGNGHANGFGLGHGVNGADKKTK